MWSKTAFRRKIGNIAVVHSIKYGFNFSNMAPESAEQYFQRLQKALHKKKCNFDCTFQKWHLNCSRTISWGSGSFFLKKWFNFCVLLKNGNKITLGRFPEALGALKKKTDYIFVYSSKGHLNCSRTFSWGSGSFFQKN